MNTLDQTAYTALIEGGKILEEDGFGIKVYRLPAQRILKLFRRRRLLSSQIWSPHAGRFARNARMLNKHDIPSIQVEAIYEIPHLDRQAVLYHEIPGTTFRHWLTEKSSTDATGKIEGFAELVVKLHNKGIHFRSLNFGNVLVRDDGNFALIDIVDMSFRWFGSLTINQRIRNQHHIARYKEDRELLTAQKTDASLRTI